MAFWKDVCYYYSSNSLEFSHDVDFLVDFTSSSHIETAQAKQVRPGHDQTFVENDESQQQQPKGIEKEIARPLQIDEHRERGTAVVRYYQTIVADAPCSQSV